MYGLKKTQKFNEWLNSLDKKVKGRLTLRLLRVELGLLGDVESVGDGVYEMREHFGAGYRMYYVKRGNEIIVMLGGGDKSTQKKDIKQAKEEAKHIE